MKISVVGGGPAGLYFALLAKTYRPEADIAVFEQNPCDATYGFGIVLADRGLKRMQDAHERSFRMMSEAMYVTRHQVLTHREQSIFVEGTGYGGALPRLRLLNILQQCCEDAGVALHYRCRVEAIDGAADMVVGADGVNSAVRAGRAAAFQPSTRRLTTRMGWYGTRKHFAFPRIVFRKAEIGHFLAVAYPYSDSMSTFVVECDAATWEAGGLAQMDDPGRQALAEAIFAPELEGTPLVSNNSIWRALPVIRCKNWHAGDAVLIGDALHNAHPSIGSGTRIAMEDSIVLADAFARFPDDPQAAFEQFRAIREPQKRKMLEATDRSIAWYARFAEKMDTLDPVALVFDYLGRTGRISEVRLREEFPEFVRRYGTFADRCGDRELVP